MVGLLWIANIAGDAQAIAAPRPAPASRTLAARSYLPPRGGGGRTLPCAGTVYAWGAEQLGAGANRQLLDQSSDFDLDQRPHFPADQSSAIKAYERTLYPRGFISTGESRAKADFSQGFWVGTFGHGGGGDSDRDRLYNQFMSGNGAPIYFASSSTMADIIGTASVFRTFAARFESEVKSRIAANHSLCGFAGSNLLARTRPAYFNDPLYAHAVMGGYQRLEATVVPSGTGITIKYKIFDHFGAGVHDASSSLPGLPALYYLQHYAGHPGKQYTPFIWWVEITHNVPLPPGYITAGA